MEDRAIGSLEHLAEEYDAARDERSAYGVQEKKLKVQILAEMHRLKRTTYERAGVKIEVVTEKEGVKVKITKPAGGGKDGDEPPF